MGRLHSKGKGISKSARPYKRTPPTWFKVKGADLEKSVCKLARKGMTPSQIGVQLRDSAGVAQVSSVTGTKILRILKKNSEFMCRASLFVRSTALVLWRSPSYLLASRHTQRSIRRFCSHLPLSPLPLPSSPPFSTPPPPPPLPKDLAPEIPEDLYHLIKKAVAVRKHLERNRADRDSKFRLILIESRIHRLARYYKRAKALPPVWRYESATAATLVT